MNRRAKFDAASFILGGEIRNRTNRQTVSDISTPCLSAYVDNNLRQVTRPVVLLSVSTTACDVAVSDEIFTVERI